LKVVGKAVVPCSGNTEYGRINHGDLEQRSRNQRFTGEEPVVFGRETAEGEKGEEG
jgi:hypothetical protein